ncbi:YgaP family membrane protein [Piscinibacter terrae]|uniref:DUF2892 domain-containing protein n=1 Tax=Piscinibacter terrae TaxID=2496871 RepID=A0A3N7HJI1_9BURK|nr:DUF2892 domain-containing protein [Albitalea terrae]RQP21673.1 DUF2892 domain-containing protein [Albitalea terrae]
MWYAKNLPVWERALRFIAALLMGLGAWRMGAGPVAFALVASAVITVVTALVGFCPMCAMVGRRRLDQ